MDKFRTFTRYVMYLAVLWLTAFFMIEIGIPAYNKHAVRQQAKKERIDRPRPAPIEPTGPDYPDAYNYDIVPDKRSRSFYFDLTQDGEVWIDARPYSEDKYLEIFEKHSSEYETVSVDILVGAKTDRSILRALQDHLTRRNFSFHIEQEKRPDIDEKQRTPDPPRPYIQGKEMLRVHFYVNANDQITRREKVYTIEELISYLDGKAKDHKLLVGLSMPKTGDLDYLNEITRTLAAKGYDYKLSP